MAKLVLKASNAFWLNILTGFTEWYVINIDVLQQF
jgi:hypothetical protein